MSSSNGHQGVFTDDPLSSASMRFSLFPKATQDGLGPRMTRPLGLRHTTAYPLPSRPDVGYCPDRQVAVDVNGRPLVSTTHDDLPATLAKKPKEWASKTYSDGDEGQEEDTWGWEEQ